MDLESDRYLIFIDEEFTSKSLQQMPQVPAKLTFTQMPNDANNYNRSITKSHCPISSEQNTSLRSKKRRVISIYLN